MKIAVVTCSPSNDYARAVSLRTALAAVPGAEVKIIRNNHTGRLRYPEVMLKVFRARFVDRPDAYMLTFRGYEMLLFMRLTLVGKPIIFDELINFTEWMVEQGRLKVGTLPFKLFRGWNRWMVKRCRIILADTEAHAEYSAILNKLSIERYRTIPVGVDETVFDGSAGYKPVSRQFTVLYYGHMMKLHGLQYVLDAARLLKNEAGINFRIVGGKKQGQVAQACAKAAEDGAQVVHESWLAFERLPRAIGEAGLTLGGPFGDTLQSRFVVTGKTYQVLACGAPVLIGKNEVNEGFTDKLNCLMVPQADVEAIAEAIRWAHQHPAELKQIGQAGRELYEKHFSQAIVNKLIKDLVAEL